MFERNILKELATWRTSAHRKPLIIRGPRQVGKTSAIHLFGKTFRHYLYFNLERPEDRNLFQQHSTFSVMLDAVLFSGSVPKSEISETLLFLDEIQSMPELISQFRYFYEDTPELAVIGAGSLLETLFTDTQPFPVGRVEYKMVRPLSFAEFLGALGEKAALEAFETTPLPVFATEKLYQLFHLFALLGGMPEVISRYAETRDLVALKPIYDSLLIGYQDDTEKYSNSRQQTHHLQFAFKSIFSVVGQRIKFEGFGNGPYKSREIGEALRLLEKAFLIRLLYPCTEAAIPLQSDFKKSPRLHFFDTGLMGYVNGYQQDLLGTQDLSKHFKGTLIEHLVGQELLTTDSSPRSGLHFWVRDKNTSAAEVDYLVNWKGTVVPIEVKSGPTGKLKSLLLLMDQFRLPFAIRFYAGALLQTSEKTPSGHPFQLLHLPYFLVSRWEDYAAWAFSGSATPLPADPE